MEKKENSREADLIAKNKKLQAQLEEALKGQENLDRQIVALREKIKEERQTTEKNFRIVQALSQSYQNVYLLNSVTNTIDIMKMDGYVTNGMDPKKKGPYPYEGFCKSYISGRVFEEDKEMVARAMYLDNVLSHLKEVDDYDFIYRVFEKEGIHYYQGHYHAVDHGYIVIGFQNVDNMVEANARRTAQMQEHYRVNMALSQEYTGVFVINCENGSLKILKLNGQQNAASLDSHLSYDEFRKQYILSFALPEYREEIMRASDLNYLMDYFNQGNKDLIIDYKVKPNKAGQVNFEFYIVPFLDGEEKQIVFGSRCVDDRIIKEEESQKIMAALSKDYQNVYLIHTKKKSVTVLKNTGYRTKNVLHEVDMEYPYDEIVNDYIENQVINEDKKLVRKCLNLDYILKKMTHDNDFVGTYRVWSYGEVHYFQFKIVCMDDSDDLVAGFHNADALVEEEKKRKEEMEKAMLEAEAANRAKTSFLFNMSHDIRTPMNAIMGFRDLLERHQDDPVRRQDYLNKIKDASAVLLSIINNVLEMARIEKGTLTVEETAWSVEQFNQSLYEVFDEMMKQKGLIFTKKIDVQHHYVYCDSSKMREIFINILSNAYKYTKTGGSVHMEVQELVNPGKKDIVYYQTTISDTGVGMSEEFLPHIFDEFARENNTTVAKVEGTGLGMPIVKRLVELLQGTIEVHSKKGEGTSIVITLPHRIAEKTVLVSSAGVEYDPNLFKGKRILLAEDNDLNAEIAIEILSEAGFVVERAEDGQVCVDRLKASPDGYYDLILMDIQMPRVNGYEATRMIRELEDPNKSSIRILAMTANAFEEDKREALRSGMNGHIAKPIDVPLMMKTLANILG